MYSNAYMYSFMEHLIGDCVCKRYHTWYSTIIEACEQSIVALQQQLHAHNTHVNSNASAVF
jgi:hypothetical protein